MPIRLMPRCLVLATAAALLLAASLGWGQATKEATAQRVALVVAIEGPIGPATLSHVEDAVERARERQAEVLILRLDTPGGLAKSMRRIIREILGATVPVVGWVAPPGAHAASAGTYILYATHVAAMAPGTNLGSATPVQIGGGFPGQPQPEKPRPGQDDAPEDRAKPSPETTEGEPATEGADETERQAPEAPADPMRAKAVNDAVAFIRSLAEMHGRNADWAEKAVREAANLSAKQAQERQVIDVIAEDIEALLAAVDGHTVTVAGRERALATKDLAVEYVEPSLITSALGVLANPNVAFILLMIGIYGLIFEFLNPGGIGPGVIGAISLVLGLYALHQLPLDYAGLALVVLGVGLLVAEAVTPTLGVLGVGGLVAFVIGAAMLFDTEVPAYRLSWWMIGGTATLSGALLVFVVGYVWRAHRRPPSGGVSSLVGNEAEVLNWSGNEGQVWAEGERWQARSEAELSSGQMVRVQAMDGLTMIVVPERSPASRGDADDAD